MKIRDKESVSPSRAPAPSLVQFLWMVGAHTAPSVMLFTAYRTVLVQAHFVILKLCRRGLGFLKVPISLTETQLQWSPNLVLEIVTQDKEGGLKKALSHLRDPLLTSP